MQFLLCFFKSFNNIKMAKRSNPYAEDFVPQSKVHVGLKQFNNNEYRLQKVYEKTLELLFRGAKKMPVKSEYEQTVEMSDKKDGLKQLFLGKDGHLMQSGVLRHSTTPKCGCGECDRCAYCEKSLCTTRQHQCQRCLLNFCARCSIEGSEGSEICLSCYS